ncbi:hypothetical protein A3D78_06120 [Candidatus Gottesmanbacteria bacterium RIFCSPHIGHO2_02_FULL_39_14]|uniref:Uncharacterized protein n=1 Tax=Candidatus Gottesmanbacteria bacterium RIFCSPHIGHO2_02_FULL_39_14 TaxID=1798383 RepID=A0A1F5ZY83_9BACT|nr:MAG: hypothetical protein A3D78_06120 [Candidatus Gottesmanbacteria bacterium RIFCSPHIGHO2_02_FULL_39_14]
MNTQQTSGNFFRIGFFVLAGALLFIGGIFSTNVFKKAPPGLIQPSPTIVFEETYQPSPTKVVPTSIEVEQNDEAGIKQAFAQKYGKNTSEVIITISKNTGIHAQGSVKFAGEAGGGWFLAYQNNYDWFIVADGNGIIPCETVYSYNFPSDMIPDC